MAFQSGRNPMERAEALERLDNGERLAVAMQHELMQIAEGGQTEPLVPEDAKAASSELMAIRDVAIKAAARFPLDGNRDLHLLFNGFVRLIDDIGAVLAERYAE